MHFLGCFWICFFTDVLGCFFFSPLFLMTGLEWLEEYGEECNIRENEIESVRFLRNVKSDIRSYLKPSPLYEALDVALPTKKKKQRIPLPPIHRARKRPQKLNIVNQNRTHES